MGVAEVDSGILHLALSYIYKFTSVLDDVILLCLKSVLCRGRGGGGRGGFAPRGRGGPSSFNHSPNNRPQ